MFTLKVFILLVFLSCGFASLNDHEKVRLENIKAITLRKGQRTTGRRVPSVPQLKCVGGSASCSRYAPKVVQCQNVGSDGSDVQWECKCDMDDSIRFGRIQVTCEGYDYPNDPYVLKGSCGLEYELDYTEKEQPIGVFLGFVIILVCIYIFLNAIRICLSGIKNRISDRFHRRNADFRNRRPNPTAPPSTEGHQTQNQDQNEPPPSYDDATSTADEVRSFTTTRKEIPTRSGFWQGVGSGGLLGFPFGASYYIIIVVIMKQNQSDETSSYLRIYFASRASSVFIKLEEKSNCDRYLYIRYNKDCSLKAAIGFAYHKLVIIEADYLGIMIQILKESIKPI